MNKADPPLVFDMKAFVPAKDPATCRRFYAELGFKQNWANDQMAEFQIGSFRFMLQNFCAEGHAENCMMSLTVASCDEWWKMIQNLRLTEKYPGIMADAPAFQPWGLRVLFLSDPSGVVWHIAEQPHG